MLLRLGLFGPVSEVSLPETGVVEPDPVSSLVVEVDDAEVVSSLESRDDSICDRLAPLCDPTPAMDMVVSFQIPLAVCERPWWSSMFWAVAPAVIWREAASRNCP